MDKPTIQVTMPDADGLMWVRIRLSSGQEAAFNIGTTKTFTEKVAEKYARLSEDSAAADAARAVTDEEVVEIMAGEFENKSRGVIVAAHCLKRLRAAGLKVVRG